jgi:tripartite-type tricarboxylate transporter receptor subunit TctC
MIAVHSSKPYKTLADLTAALKQKGDKASYGVSNPGSLVVAEMYKTVMGLPTVQVDYKSSPDAVNDLASGALEFFSADPIFGAAMARKGEWRILAISSAERVKAVGDLPTLKEQGVDVDITAWWGVFAPQATPKPVIEQINKWFAEVVGSEKTKTFMAQFGGDTLIETPEVGQARMLRDINNWADYARIAKIKKLD